MHKKKSKYKRMTVKEINEEARKMYQAGLIEGVREGRKLQIEEFKRLFQIKED